MGRDQGAAVTYLEEVRVNWRYLAAACLGLGSGYMLNLYISSAFAPHLLSEFGWSKSQFALLGGSILVSIIALPIVGRICDLVGVRPMIAFGVTATPLIFVAFSRINDNFVNFFLLSVLQLAVGTTTASLVYSRLIAEHFHRARGLALALSACTAPATGALCVRSLSAFIDAHGWRAGYLAVAVATAIGGAIAFLLLPREGADDAAVRAPPKRRSARDYPEILRSHAFRRIAVGMLLCNLTMMVMASQLQLILLDRGTTPAAATSMVSLYAAGIVIGRLCCGLALDRFPTHIVSAISLGLPCIGLFILASGVHSIALLGSAVMTVGLSMGAELDALAYLVMRYFKVEIYSTVLGLVQPTIALSSALGALLLSVTLKMSGGFGLFLYLAGAATLVGCSFFLMLGRIDVVLHRSGQVAEAAC